jgi:hypothetical protein
VVKTATKPELTRDLKLSDRSFSGRLSVISHPSSPKFQNASLFSVSLGGFPDVFPIVPPTVAQLPEVEFVPQPSAQLADARILPQLPAKLPWAHHVILMEKMKDRAPNPNGIPTQSPRVAESARLPWVTRRVYPNPNGVASIRFTPITTTPLGLMKWDSFSQGSSCLATAGLMA